MGLEKEGNTYSSWTKNGIELGETTQESAIELQQFHRGLHIWELQQNMLKTTWWNDYPLLIVMNYHFTIHKIYSLTKKKHTHTHTQCDIKNTTSRFLY